MFSSTIIATINRPSLTAAVLSILEQDFSEDEFEVIVVNDSGERLPPMDWQLSERVRVLNTPCRERSVARNAGAAVATGRYLHFLDDDDVMLPGALKAFWALSLETDAAWLYGAWEAMDDAGNVTERFQPSLQGDVYAEFVAGELVPFGVSLVKSEAFFGVGGYDASFIIVEDFDLARRLALREKISQTESLVVRYRRGVENSTADWSSFARYEYLSREKTLSQTGSFERLEESVRNRPYWRGRVARIFLSSSLYNLRTGHQCTALARLVAFLVLSRQYMLNRPYWSGLRRAR